MVAFFLGIYYTIHICAYTDSVKGIFTMKNIKKIIAAVLLLCIAVTACACRYTSNTITVSGPVATQPSDQIVIPTQPVEWNTQPTQPQQSEPTDATVPVSEPVTFTPPDPNATLPYQEPTQPGQPVTEAPVTQANPASWNKQEVVKFLSDAVNKTKAYTGQVTVDRSEDLGITIESIKPNLPALKNVANSLVSKFIKPVNETVQFSGGKGVSDGEEIPLLLPKRQAFTLTADGVTQASAAQSGNNIVVDITLVSEQSSMSNPPKYNSQALGYLDVNSVDLSMVTIDSLDFVYLGSTIHAVIGPDGYVLSADYHIPLQVAASGKAIGIPGSFTGTGYQTEKWVINW